jgi:hypothetical protein
VANALQALSGSGASNSCRSQVSALPPGADVGADIVEPPVSAIIGREQIEPLFNHLVG